MIKIGLVIIVINSFLLFKVCRKVWKEWINPIFLINVLYTFLIMCACLGLENCKFYLSGIAWMLIALWFLTLGGFAGKLIWNQKWKIRDNEENSIFISNRGWIFLRIVIAFGILGWLYQVAYNGFSLNDFTSINSLAQMNHNVAIYRYSGQAKTDIITKITNVNIYIAPVIGGLLYAYSDTKAKRRICLFSLVPITLIMLFSNAKAGFLASLILWFSSYSIAFFYIYKTSPKVDFRKLIICVLIVMMIIGVLIFSMMLRIGNVDINTLNIVKEKFMVYAFGEIQAFDCWFSTQRTKSEISGGIHTFMAIFNTLGIVKREQGVYSLIPNAVGNVYTLFRGIIEDFGTVGGLIFIGMTGCMSV